MSGLSRHWREQIANAKAADPEGYHDSWDGVEKCADELDAAVSEILGYVRKLPSIYVYFGPERVTPECINKDKVIAYLLNL